MFMKPAVLFAALASLILATLAASLQKSHTYQGGSKREKDMPRHCSRQTQAIADSFDPSCSV